MATPAGEPFAESSGEAVQTAVAAMRLVLAIADAVRRAREREQGEEKELPPAEQAVTETVEDVKKLVPSDISVAVFSEADWPRMAQQLLALRRAGVNLEDFLPRVGDIAVTVRDQVAANAERVARERTGEWERVLRQTLPAGPVREAILSSPAWPDMAAQMAEMNRRGVDVRGLLASAHDEGLGVDQAIAKVLAAAPVTASRDALLSYGPLTDGLDLPPNLNLDNRSTALRQLAISSSDNERYVRWVREAMPGHEAEANLLVSAKQWPLIAARMAKLEDQGKPVQHYLTRVLTDTSWREERGSKRVARLVEAASDALRQGDAPAGARSRVSTTAARSQSTTVGPTNRQAKSAAPAEAAVPAHRQSGPAPTRGKAK
ncbi:hypothetical protein ACWDBD_36795 [Streptomyces sp. NPDC001118]